MKNDNKGIIHLEIEKIGEWDNSIIHLSVNDIAQKDFAYLMLAAEFFLNAAAQESNAGYEKAIELIVGGAKKHNVRKDNSIN